MIYTDRMKNNKDFLALFKRGRFICDKNCVVYFTKNGTDKNKLGISTGKKAGNAVVRSRCRRIIRQAYRENEAEFPHGYNIVVVARAAAGGAKSTDISLFFRKKLIPEMKRNPKNCKNTGKVKNNSSFTGKGGTVKASGSEPR